MAFDLKIRSFHEEFAMLSVPRASLPYATCQPRDDHLSSSLEMSVEELIAIAGGVASLVSLFQGIERKGADRKAALIRCGICFVFAVVAIAIHPSAPKATADIQTRGRVPAVTNGSASVSEQKSSEQPPDTASHSAPPQTVGRVKSETTRPGDENASPDLSNSKSARSKAAAPGETEVSNRLPLPSAQSMPGQIRENSRDGLAYVWIPAGSFVMGCSPGDSDCYGNENPPHQVEMTHGFWIGQTEVTVAAWKRFSESARRDLPVEPTFYGRSLNPGWADSRQPIVNLSWDQAQDFCVWANGRLPTEAEWEYAARADHAGPAGADVANFAWFGDNSGELPVNAAELWETRAWPKMAENNNRLHPVGQKRANYWNLYDMLGNAAEWTSDCYSIWRDTGSVRDPENTVPNERGFHVLRGGTWYNDIKAVRVSFRSMPKKMAGVQGNYYGVRCVVPIQ